MARPSQDVQDSRSGQTPRQWDSEEELARETEDGRRETGNGTGEMGLMFKSTEEVGPEAQYPVPTPEAKIVRLTRTPADGLIFEVAGVEVASDSDRGEGTMRVVSMESGDAEFLSDWPRMAGPRRSCWGLCWGLYWGLFWGLAWLLLALCRMGQDEMEQNGVCTESGKVGKSYWYTLHRVGASACLAIGPHPRIDWTYEEEKASRLPPNQNLRPQHQHTPKHPQSTNPGNGSPGAGHSIRRPHLLTFLEFESVDMGIYKVALGFGPVASEMEGTNKAPKHRRQRFPAPSWSHVLRRPK
ncbi:hypothetical protein EDB81DRAFT_856530 [Dactylonectria macrodidyma]|uniref:Uncharacterized protein n=1 Tax=Dactylonectria macrodidyma TaxID=307937 RepID=A0A9P9EYN8_9HYPO|nr:hypothetical protein EDB81DRAFT_856530 [Dactylonectria macrodidyma]